MKLTIEQAPLNRGYYRQIVEDEQDVRRALVRYYGSSCSSATEQDEGQADGSHRRPEFAAVLPWYEDRAARLAMSP
jgi:hypothetical protein